MSYVPFQPDVWPPAVPEIDRRAELRWVRWACGILLYLLAIAGWVYWMKLPPRIEPPIATIPLDDGTEFRVVQCSVGPQLRVGNRATFENRIRLRDGSSGGAWEWTSTSLNGGWLVLTHFDPNGETFHEPAIQNVRLTEPGSPYALHADSERPGGGAPFSGIPFPVFPRKSPTLTFSLTYEGRPQQATIPNPFLSVKPPPATGVAVEGVASRKIAPPPQELHKGGFTARLNKVTFRLTEKPSPGNPSAIAEPHYQVTHAEAKSGVFRKEHEWFDPTGNVVTRGVLPWSEPVWGLRLKVTQTAQFLPSPEQVMPLGTISVPGPGQARSLPVPAELISSGVSDIFVVGAGTYNWVSNRLMVTNAAGGGTRTTVLQVNRTPHQNSFTESNWRIYLLGSRSKTSTLLGSNLLRVRKGDEAFESSSNGTSRSGSSTQQHFGNFARQGSMLRAGDEVTIDVIKPASHTFEFLLPRPDFPGPKTLEAPKAR